MYTFIITATLVVAGFLGVNIGTATTVEAAFNRGCVTRSEWQQIKPGITKARTHQILGTSGRRTYYGIDNRWRSEVYEYRGCRGFRGELEILFNNYLYTQDWTDHFGAMNVDHKSRRVSYSSY